MDRPNGLKKHRIRSLIQSAAFAVLLTVLISSCYYRENEVIRPEVPDEISYSEDIQPIWDARCNEATCHGGRWAPNLLSSVSYNELIGGGFVDEQTPSNSIIYTACLPGGSMAEYTEPGDAEKILQWIEDGANND